jgi:hypothetical protein
MAVSAQLPWKRLVAEVVAIVFGILLAFAIDAWWQDRADRQVEAQYLRALRDDLDASLSLLDAADASQQLQTEYLESLLRIDEIDPEPEDVRLWLREGVFVIGTYQPQLSSLRDLESSGQSQLIRDLALRSALASVAQTVDRLRNVQDDIIESQQSLLDPYLVENFDLVAVLGSESGATVDEDSSILESQAFRSRVAFKLDLRGFIGNTMQDLRRDFDESLTLIDRRLDELDFRGE